MTAGSPIGSADGPRVERIEHTGGSPEGANSTYVLPERGLVIDPGPPGDRPWDTLTAGFRSVGLAVEAVDAVVVTHWHAGHAGSAPRLAERADAELYLHEADAPLVGRYAEARQARLDRDARRLREWGVPDAVVDAITGADDPSPMPSTVPVRAVTDGDAVGGGEVVHTPGHTSGHLSLVVGDALFLGDAVLPTYTPNVGGSDTRTEHALRTYLDTLDRLSGLAEEADGAGLRPYPGHGSRVDLAGRIETVRHHHADRIRDVVSALPGPDGRTPVTDSAERREDDAGPDRTTTGGTPWAVAREVFGELRGIHAKMGAGEAAAHLDYAADLGFVERVGTGPERYRRTAQEPSAEALARAVSPSRYR